MAYRVPAPYHLGDDGLPIRLDEPLLAALIAARGSPLWDRLSGALESFLRANTDSDEVALQTEVVDMTGAFEAALGVWGSDDLKQAFGEHFQPTKDILPRDAARVPAALRNGPSVRRLWIDDLYKLRNAHAHGAQAPPSDGIWDTGEHLLLGAYAFPLLVKSLLREEGFYTLTDNDQQSIDLFEWRARSADHLSKRNGSYVWSLL